MKTIQRLAEEAEAALASSRDEVAAEAQFLARMAEKLGASATGERYARMAAQVEARALELAAEASAAREVARDEAVKGEPSIPTEAAAAVTEIQGEDDPPRRTLQPPSIAWAEPEKETP